MSLNAQYFLYIFTPFRTFLLILVRKSVII
nr:MAG TPA: hypothetical protein [Caudoviricetes sp.]DAI48327.1 MAG TPA: hypothetical protein [Caudoviricetes sp.]DAL07538.1 MAG TPA: hypothetical protein [Caudoviricetes sp.]